MVIFVTGPPDVFGRQAGPRPPSQGPQATGSLLVTAG